ncbi:hypothetical protein B0A55_00839 [Friedmanniomyces simplex]|uniref:Uncharacterized protein n=1 Tax=Friedmanniomyces simplex TaxID=329884 RepID=A0A4U0XYX8_9PEZI|nr:hypothetical protein B0A55_00839 [Friedmanniomyces simplex]
MSSSAAISKQQPSHQEVSLPGQGESTMEAKEHSASASASAGLNLNVFGALAGAFTGKSKKETAADGSAVEHREEEGRVKGAGKGDLNAQGAAQGEEKGREMRQAVKER